MALPQLPMVLSPRHLLLGVAAALLLGCQQPSTPPPPTAPSASQLKAQGDELAAVADYAAAAAKYRAALDVQPDEVSIHYALGVALSRLNRREEAAEQFRWVVARGAADSPEGKAARDWLVNAGLVSPAVTFGAPGSAEPEPGKISAASPKGTVKGQLEWRGVDPKEHLVRVDIRIVGEDESNRDVKLLAPSRIGRSYGFRELPPGQYRLTAEAYESRLLLWDQKVTVLAGKDTVLDLTNANSQVPADQLPLPPPSSD